jgi:hypothetical protein
MFAQIIAMAASAMAQAAGSIIQSEQQKNALATAMNEISNARELYSGKALNRQMTNEGGKQAALSARNAGNVEAGSVNRANNSNAMSNAQNNGDALTAGISGYNSGANTAKELSNANSNLMTTTANQMMNQGKLNAAATSQGMQTAGNAAGGAVNLYNQIKGNKATSDENEKTEINNDSGLPSASIQDSLRQLETILYQYKHPEKEGEDNLEHVGFTAQSAEKTPLFEDCVSTNEEGIKQIDKWRLLESITAAEAELQREIDALEDKIDD